MALTTLSDSELLVEFRNPVTKEKAFTSIIKKYQEKLYWHLRRMVVDHDDANDVLQNVMIRVWNGLENFREIVADSIFWNALKNTFIFTLNVPVGMAVALMIAVMLHRRTRGVSKRRDSAAAHCPRRTASCRSCRCARRHRARRRVLRVRHVGADDRQHPAR